MDIAVAGLGLIGGSICKALKQNTKHKVYGIDTDEKTAVLALESGAIDGIITPANLKGCDITFACMYPKACVSFILENAGNFKKGSVVTDVCGIKEYVCESVEKTLFNKGVFYVGGHPMAGKENSGFIYSDSKMFNGASYILAKTAATDTGAYETMRALVISLGCNIIETDPKTHDRIIAYTSQLAHVVSSSYIKSPSVGLEKGFTGGSFQDMTRVALLSEDMWKDLFLLNGNNLLIEIDNILKNLTDYRDAIAKGDGNTLRRLLKEGKDIKLKHLK